MAWGALPVNYRLPKAEGPFDWPMLAKGHSNRQG